MRTFLMATLVISIGSCESLTADELDLGGPENLLNESQLIQLRGTGDEGKASLLKRDELQGGLTPCFNCDPSLGLGGAGAPSPLQPQIPRVGVDIDSAGITGRIHW